MTPSQNANSKKDKVDFNAIKLSSDSLDVFLRVFQDAFEEYNYQFLDAHRAILTSCYQHIELAPSLTAASQAQLAKAWLKKYNDGYQSRISRRISKASGTKVDPIISSIINARLTHLTNQHLEQINYAHRLSMSAENILGLLLEEFLAEQLSDYGWHCCWGETLRHVDFCHNDGSLLQIKNRSNSENSSSSRVRINKPIEKWFRVDAKKGSYQWSYFNQRYETDRFSEERFIAFVQQVLKNNPEALAVEESNPWKNTSN